MYRYYDDMRQAVDKPFSNCLLPMSVKSLTQYVTSDLFPWLKHIKNMKPLTDYIESIIEMECVTANIIK